MSLVELNRNAKFAVCQTHLQTERLMPGCMGQKCRDACRCDGGNSPIPFPSISDAKYRGQGGIRVVGIAPYR